MSTTKKTAVAVESDAATWDIDAWIDETKRPDVELEFFPKDREHAARISVIESLIPAAEATSPENRGIGDVSADALRAQIAEMVAERAATVKRVTVRQLTDLELEVIKDGAIKAGVTDGVTLLFWRIGAACTPTFTPEQLARLYKRDLSGEDMVDRLSDAHLGLQGALPSVPS